MKRIWIAGLIGICMPSLCMAQDMGSTGIGYIPGMPLPAQAAPSEAPSAAQPASGGARNGRGDGKITAVKVAGQQKDARQAPKEAPAPEPMPAPTTKQDSYRGVTPPTRMVPENQNTFTKTRDNQLSWIGFMPEAQTHRIFIQTTSPTTFDRVATSPERVEILAKDTKLAVSNNKRELEMKYFKTPFSKAYAKPAGRHVKVIVELREPVKVDVRQQDNLINIFVPAGSGKPDSK